MLLRTKIAVLKGFSGDLILTEGVIVKIGPNLQRLGKERKHKGEGDVNDVVPS